MSEEPTRYIDDDGAIYSAEIVPPADDSLGAKYHVDLVRATTDEQGLDHEQRLTVGQHPSWMEAEEHLFQVETALERDGLAGWGDDAARLRGQPDQQAVTYLAVAYPPDGDPSTAYLLAIGANGIASALIADQVHEPIEAAVERVDAAFALEGDTAGLAAAQVEAERTDSRMVGSPLFASEDRPLRHVDGGGTAHWFDVIAGDDPGARELRYFRELDMADGETRRDSYPVMPLPDDDPGSAWPLPGLEMYLERGDVFMAQQLAHDVADHYGQAFPDPLDLPALNPQPDYSFGYGIGPDNEPSLEAVKTWMAGGERRFDTFTVAEYGLYDEAQTDERELEEALKTQGLQAAMNLAEQMAVAGGYLDPQRADGRVFFEDDAPPDPFTTVREREWQRALENGDVTLNAEYHIAAIAANDEARLDVLKRWGEGDLQRQALLIPQPDWETARANAEFATEQLEAGDLQGAMTLVELAGIEAGVLDPDRADPRLFTQGPPDPFTTIRERELAQAVDITELDTEPYTPVTPEPEVPDYPTLYREFAAEAAREREANAALEGAAWFEATFEQAEIQLLPPLDDRVNYAVVVQEADPWTTELAVEKYWRAPRGFVGRQSVTLDRFDPDDEPARAAAEVARADLMALHGEGGLEAMMRQAERIAIQNDELSADRADPRLFTQGPPDRFETLAQQLDGEIQSSWNTDGEKLADSLPQWRLETLPVADPDGEPLGHALHIAVYDGLPHDPERRDIPAAEPVRVLEIAHFETTAAADRFGREFNGYIVPGLLDGPELAVEVARLEGLPAEWKTLEGDDRAAFQRGDLTLTHDRSDWHPYNPNAERDARIEAEGLYAEPLPRLIERDEPGIPAGAPELDF